MFSDHEDHSVKAQRKKKRRKVGKDANVEYSDIEWEDGKAVAVVEEVVKLMMAEDVVE